MTHLRTGALLGAALLPLSTLAAEPALTTDAQRFSYAVGTQVVQNIVRQGVEVDAEAFRLAVEDVVAGREPRLTPDEMNAAMEKQATAAQARAQERGTKALEAGRAYLEANKAKEGVTVLPSGIQYRVEKSGSGKSPTVDDTVSVHYAGRLIDGTEFDSSYKRSEPFTLKPSAVIKGWQEVLPLMKEGDKWTVWIPSELAYGPAGAGGAIGPNEVLIFEIELLEVKAGE